LPSPDVKLDKNADTLTKAGFPFIMVVPFCNVNLTLLISLFNVISVFGLSIIPKHIPIKFVFNFVTSFIAVSLFATYSKFNLISGVLAVNTVFSLSAIYV